MLIDNNFFDTDMKKNSMAVVLPVLFGFLAMGFIDMIGLVTNYVKADFNMSDSLVNMISLSCFFWFLILSIPVGAALTKWGRKKMVLVSLINFVSVAEPRTVIMSFFCNGNRSRPSTERPDEKAAFTPLGAWSKLPRTAHTAVFSPGQVTICFFCMGLTPPSG